MSHDSHHPPLSKKERKKAQVKKNRHIQEIFHVMRLRQQEETRVEDLKESLGPAQPAATAGDEAWSDKVSSIRNRLTGQKRLSKERWNRFAGTGGEGGRGL
jgi:hypothetical protein